MIVACSILFGARAMAQHVIAFEPSAPVLPANTLRAYFVFDRPARGVIRQSEIQLIGADGKRIEDCFMDFGTELCSPDGKRLTIFFDPGKIKRGVEAPNSELAPLKAAAPYTIKVRDFQKRFRVGAAVRKRLDPVGRDGRRAGDAQLTTSVENTARQHIQMRRGDGGKACHRCVYRKP
jgi:hypothetical protein